MNTNIKIFSNPQFGQIRTMVMPDGQIGFVGKDVAMVLGYKETAKAIRMHVDEDDKGVYKMDTPGGVQQVTFINESGLYSLILSSKLPKAREFKHWVTSEVLPQIRKTGGYIPVCSEDDEKTILARAVTILTKTVKLQNMELAEQDLEIAMLTPKAEYAEQVLLSPTCYTMTEIAKSLSMTVQELQHWLHDRHIIYRDASGIWMLYAKYLNKGYEAYRTHKHDGVLGNKSWTESYLVWTERGKEFIHKLWKTTCLEGSISVTGGSALGYGTTPTELLPGGQYLRG